MKTKQKSKLLFFIVFVLCIMCACESKVICKSKKEFGNWVIVCGKSTKNNNIVSFDTAGVLLVVEGAQMNSYKKAYFDLFNHMYIEVDSSYKYNEYYTTTYDEIGNFRALNTERFGKVWMDLSTKKNVLRDTQEVRVLYTLDGDSRKKTKYCLVERYLFVKGKLKKGIFYSIINTKKDSVLIKLTYSGMTSWENNHRLIKLKYFEGDINQYDWYHLPPPETKNTYWGDNVKKYGGTFIIIKDSLNPPRVEMKNQSEVWLPKEKKYTFMFWTIDGKTNLPIDYNLFVVDTRDDVNEQAEELAKRALFYQKIKQPGKLENRKDIQEMMVNSGCYAYDNNGKLKLVINPLKLVKENTK